MRLDIRLARALRASALLVVAIAAIALPARGTTVADEWTMAVGARQGGDWSPVADAPPFPALGPAPASVAMASGGAAIGDAACVLMSLVLLACTCLVLRAGRRADGPAPTRGRSPPDRTTPPGQDPLTGLADRAALQEGLAGTLSRVEVARGSAALLILDLARLRQVNDMLGHAAGDALLRQAAERLRQGVRDADLLARIGGDAFGLVPAGPATPAEATRLAERLAARLREPFRLAGQTVEAGANIGIAIAGPAEAATVEGLLRQAQAALSHAKAEARPGGAIRCFSAGMERPLEARLSLRQDLRQAVLSRGFALHYQPIQATVGRRLLGHEALLRWPHPRLGMIGPAEFIPLAEETGLILPLGAWVLETACHEAARWPAPLTVAVNLSPAQFERGDLPATVQAALAASGLAPSRLELEITEGMLMRDPSGALAQVGALRALGVRVVMDDFGDGWSSLGNLRRYPFDKLKMDRSFVRDLAEDPRAAAFVQTIVGLGHALGIPVTAEGVETEAQLRLLTEAGCDEVQGYLLGRPVPPEALSLPDRLAPPTLAAE